jgi:hypothetical protein
MEFRGLTIPHPLKKPSEAVVLLQVKGGKQDTRRWEALPLKIVNTTDGTGKEVAAEIQIYLRRLAGNDPNDGSVIEDIYVDGVVVDRW